MEKVTSRSTRSRSRAASTAPDLGAGTDGDGESWQTRILKPSARTSRRHAQQPLESKNNYIAPDSEQRAASMAQVLGDRVPDASSFAVPSLSAMTITPATASGGPLSRPARSATAALTSDKPTLRRSRGSNSRNGAEHVEENMDDAAADDGAEVEPTEDFFVDEGVVAAQSSLKSISDAAGSPQTSATQPPADPPALSAALAPTVSTTASDPPIRPRAYRSLSAPSLSSARFRAPEGSADTFKEVAPLWREVKLKEDALEDAKREIQKRDDVIYALRNGFPAFIKMMQGDPQAPEEQDARNRFFDEKDRKMQE
ncbi:hypothetical protein BDK51DRAFT_51719 [Blyttiomyces helicus]|uniref:Uncharacterized protein n=1 Tax=Blyttiomyces helicus TaxID=388810 RepID=A0A4P9WL24_9FUNG|nr:hypothetical protein BDK51DRAFT_51719 [Blyttiomyces helicus]|eukprot:RKO92288.1 hypothetical protein BDK51DRAFT_51719 [Blyttiomyces helicus]